LPHAINMFSLKPSTWLRFWFYSDKETVLFQNSMNSP